jgi:4-amino-4-deoxy-L-arabinose transferase-like glycosyltransferase
MVSPGTTSRTEPASSAAAAGDLHYQRIAVYALLAVTVLRLLWLVGNPINLYPDEAQYWLWSRSPAFGYFSKPPLLPWIIALTTAIFGEDEFAVRVASPFLHLATGLVVYASARRLYDARVACWSAVLYATLPAVSLSAAIMSTDVPLMLCWAVALYAFIRAREEDNSSRRWWIVVGIATGIGLLAKFAMAYWLLSALLLVIAFRDERRYLPNLLAASALALVIYLPNFVWNAVNGFASYRHTGANANLSGPLFHTKAFFEFLASQFGVFGPLLFGTLIVIVLIFPRSLADRRARLLAVFALPTLAMMLIVSFLSRAHPNWSAPTYVSATILVTAFLLERGRSVVLAASLAIHIAAALFLIGGRQAAAAMGVELPAKLDLLHRVRGWDRLGHTVGDMLLQRPGVTLMTWSREDLSALIYYVHPHPFDAVIWNPGGGARNQFEMDTDMSRYVGRDFLFVSQSEIEPWDAARFTAVSPPVHIVIPIGGGLARRYFVYDLAGFKGYR